MENKNDKTNFEVITANVEQLAGTLCGAYKCKNLCFGCDGCEFIDYKNELISWLKEKSS